MAAHTASPPFTPAPPLSTAPSPSFGAQAPTMPSLFGPGLASTALPVPLPSVQTGLAAQTALPVGSNVGSASALAPGLISAQAGLPNAFVNVTPQLGLSTSTGIVVRQIPVKPIAMITDVNSMKDQAGATKEQ